MTEIELKARIENPEKIKARLAELGIHCYSYIKNDTYWEFFEKTYMRLRIRKEEKTYTDGRSGKTILVTHKTREIHTETEVNNEREFAISDSSIFEEILAELGFTQDIKKEKQGWYWELKSSTGEAPLSAELSLVKSLGWFLELEILSDTSDERNLKQNRSRLLAVLDSLGISREAIESRPYSELIREQHKNR